MNIFSTLAIGLCLLLFSIRILLSLYQTLVSPLRHIPGPFWTRFTKLWYFNHVRRGQFQEDNLNLHRKYGPIVRIAPNHYSISELSAVKTVYGTGSKFLKSDWYEGWAHPDPQRFSLFPDRDARRHAETRKRFSSLYSMSSLVNYEEFVDTCADILKQKLDDFANRKEPLNMGRWFQYYAFDVIGDITFGDRFGFMDRGEDIAQLIDALHKLMTYSTLVGIYPQFHKWIYGPLSRFSWSGAGGRAYIMRFVQDSITRHNAVKRDPEEVRGPSETHDFLEKMVMAREKSPEKITEYHLYMMCQSNVVAGSDTTAISLSTILYHLLHNPECLDKLRAEIEEYTATGRLSEHVTFKESQEMPYFQAVIKEALRMHSATGLPLWRVVPDAGAELSGCFFPGGTIVGINTWVAHYNEEVFPNAQTFRPERWIEAEANPEKLKAMNDMYMPFGLGSRTCIGKHISILEMSKLIPQLVRDFDFKFVNPNRTWKTENLWFVKPADFELYVQRRRSEKT